ncbi:endonuclease/exonuclease/phosphatase family protein [Actinosynnema mirum]|uniref:Endonuclease/exonuclease/phosphatase n=1 Tax=Actinosynnema mirum (strain ATCC 29888 / DSM 43827 / JCM 3225 / NBRC 14064 / NCIMB 13271 / NRRL B-12336 / IMRU 3971 / 101) TaxID=446462 RepID=C6WBX1_ACTMD|nr:endonuclease/exonuclease/phosphatase family protein [Actinosynnema mirum]ACU37538.1 Endonuclease/exonuclease/phosphatase [Actinosynnema mirum DSM 43827]
MTEQDQLRVLTWNVQRASAARTRAQVEWLVRQEADVLVLTEVSAGESGGLLARWLRERGYQVLLPDPAPEDRYRVLLACPADVGLEEADSGVPMPHRCVAAKVKSSAMEVGVVGLYVPSRGPRERRNVAKRAFQEEVSAALPGLTARLGAAGPVVVAGDQNVVEPGHIPAHPVFGAWEYDFYRSFAEAGFTDAFRLRHPEAVEHSWFGRDTGAGKRNGYRFDHVFLTTTHAALARDCRYLHTPREDGLSDHSAMEVVLDQTVSGIGTQLNSGQKRA